ncbi:MAG: hypothetical protein IJB04_08090 [Oscillospiraceae bacterium]|nr:hypothetical protein [Oscillospiraceae bacterium]
MPLASGIFCVLAGNAWLSCKKCKLFLIELQNLQERLAKGAGKQAALKVTQEIEFSEKVIKKPK